MPPAPAVAPLVWRAWLPVMRAVTAAVPCAITWIAFPHQ
jgi:hypothetical protein